MKAENEMEEFMQLLCSNKRNGPGSINLAVTGCTRATDKKTEIRGAVPDKLS